MCHIGVLLVFILLNFNHVKDFYERIFVSSLQCVVFLVSCHFLLMLSISYRSVLSESVELCEITVAVSAYFAEQPFILDVLSLLSLRLYTLPRFSDEFKHDEEDKELNEDDCKHVYEDLSLHHCRSNQRH